MNAQTIANEAPTSSNTETCTTSGDLRSGSVHLGSGKLFSRANILPRLGILCCLVVITIGIALRLTNIDLKPLWHDEACTMSTVIDGNQGGLAVLQDKVLSREQFLEKSQPGPLSWHNLLTSIARDRAPNGPVYFVCVRLWAELFGNTAFGLRFLSVALSIAVLPLVYWLCLELFRKPVIAWTSMTLFAVSPFQMMYAHDARCYMLLTCLQTLGVILLSRACRNNTPVSWAAYGLAQALSICTHPLSVFVTGLEGVAVFLTARGRMRSYLLSLAVPASAILLWVLFYVTPYAQVHERRICNQWMGRAVSMSELLTHWHTVLPIPFYDSSWNLWGKFHLLRSTVLAAMGASLLFCACRLRGLPRALLLFIPIGFFAVISIVDLTQGGTRSTAPRYILPTLMWSQVAVAVTLAYGLTAKSRAAKCLAGLSIFCLMVLGIGSMRLYVTSDTWWMRHHKQCEELEEYVPTLKDPLFVSERPAMAIAVSQHGVPVILSKNLKSLPQGYNIVITSPSMEILEYARAHGWKMQQNPAIDKKNWILRKPE